MHAGDSNEVFDGGYNLFGSVAYDHSVAGWRKISIWFDN